MLESPYTGSLCIEIDFHIKKPKQTRYGQFPPADLDNLVKSVLDAGNGILYKDDRQIVKIVAKKSWQVQGKIIIVMNEEE